jgi:hypothetical protein
LENCNSVIRYDYDSTASTFIPWFQVVSIQPDIL